MVSDHLSLRTGFPLQKGMNKDGYSNPFLLIAS